MTQSSLIGRMARSENLRGWAMVSPTALVAILLLAAPLGMIVAFGGPPYDASSGVGVWGDFVVYYPRLSSLSQNNYGHYHTVRRSGADGMRWVGAGYTHQADGSVLPYYLLFSR